MKTDIKLNQKPKISKFLANSQSSEKNNFDNKSKILPIDDNRRLIESIDTLDELIILIQPTSSRIKNSFTI
ncbi:hypothetical protein PIROE2DRAFT_8053 [Piromyces sp. E2]|nr:hypothetical protein PIROE2DRAFT_8053 [Piromyces sp. E2]|eukprot:OUM64990.1 hypothetical protein PIROE2DRAFT_8053 [Piromyces sp. E2]